MREFLKKENYATCTTEIFGPFQVLHESLRCGDLCCVGCASRSDFSVSPALDGVFIPRVMIIPLCHRVGQAGIFLILTFFYCLYGFPGGG
jgi:hypothetical protein